MINYYYEGKYNYFYLPMDLKVILNKLIISRRNAMSVMRSLTLFTLSISWTSSWNFRVSSGIQPPLTVRVQKLAG